MQVLEEMRNCGCWVNLESGDLNSVCVVSVSGALLQSRNLTFCRRHAKDESKHKFYHYCKTHTLRFQIRIVVVLEERMKCGSLFTKRVVFEYIGLPEEDVVENPTDEL